MLASRLDVGLDAPDAGERAADALECQAKGRGVCHCVVAREDRLRGHQGRLRVSRDGRLGPSGREDMGVEKAHDG